jgi:hypothetical protein
MAIVINVIFFERPFYSLSNPESIFKIGGLKEKLLHICKFRIHRLKRENYTGNSINWTTGNVLNEFEFDEIFLFIYL